MFEKDDLTAPTCNDCHGNHGATPPGIESVTLICGQCHGREADLFAKTAKHEGFVKHNELLASATSCRDCHDQMPERTAATVHRFGECVTCHENHGVMRPTVALFAPLPDVPCAFCHEGSGPLADAEPLEKREHYKQLRDQLLAEAKKLKLDGDARFDWLVDMAQALPTHVVRQGDGKRELRPEFARLFAKFRIGKTHYVYTNPATGKNVSVAIRRCSDCHIDPTTDGAKTAKHMIDGMQEATSLSARAERVLLAAKRGGVEVRTARTELDSAVDSQIEMQALVHTFADGGSFAEKQKEAAAHASAALTAGQQSLAELAYRRRGLGAAVGIIVLVLGGLAIKIRSLGD